MLSILLCLSSLASSFGQDFDSVDANASKADSLYDKRLYREAIQYYDKLLASGGPLVNLQVFKIAYSHYKLGENDRAIQLLYRLVYGLGDDNTPWLEAYFSAKEMADREDFKAILRQSRCYGSARKLPLIPQLAVLFDSLYRKDQLMRTQLQTHDPKASSAQPTDRHTLQFLDSVYQVYGWLSSSQLGVNGADAQSLLIQHADLRTQKKWLPRFRLAVENCLLLRERLALLIDRIAVREGRPQVYGTQLKFDKRRKQYIPYPISDPERVDHRRAEMGMSDLETSLTPYRRTR